MKETLEPLFRMALSRVNSASKDIERIEGIFPSDSVKAAQEYLNLALAYLKGAQEWAAEEYRFEVRGSMKT